MFLARKAWQCIRQPSEGFGFLRSRKPPKMVLLNGMAEWEAWRHSEKPRFLKFT